MGSFDFLTEKDINQVSPDLVQRVTRTLSEKNTVYRKAVLVGGVSFEFITSVNSTVLGMFNDYGKSLGGVRVMDYVSVKTSDRRDYAQFDANNLGRAMVRKWAMLTLMGTQLAEKGKISAEELRAFYMGGGKSVIFVNSLSDYFHLSSVNRDTLFHLYGKFIHQDIKGEFMSGKDMNTTVHDMNSIKSETPFTSCYSKELGGSGNPSPVTAEGVYRYLLGVTPLVFGDRSLNDLTIGVQGVGSVGTPLTEKIHRDFPDARLVLTSLDETHGKNLAQKVNGIYVKPDALFDVPMDIFSPNAGSEVLGADRIARLSTAGVKLICGAANCQFETDGGKIKHELAKRCDIDGIYVVPEYSANLGGILNLSFEFPVVNHAPSTERAEEIAAGSADLAVKIYQISKSVDRLPYQIANELSDRVLAAFLEKNCAHEIDHYLLA